MDSDQEPYDVLQYPPISRYAPACHRLHFRSNNLSVTATATSTEHHIGDSYRATGAQPLERLSEEFGLVRVKKMMERVVGDDQVKTSLWNIQSLHRHVQRPERRQAEFSRLFFDFSHHRGADIYRENLRTTLSEGKAEPSGSTAQIQNPSPRLYND